MAAMEISKTLRTHSQLFCPDASQAFLTSLQVYCQIGSLRFSVEIG